MVPRRRRWINDLDQSKWASAEQIQVYRPDKKCPWGRRDIRRFALSVNAVGDGGNI